MALQDAFSCQLGIMLSCRYLLQLSAPATNIDSAAADFLPVLDALLEVPSEVRQALTKSSPPGLASAAEGSQAGAGSNQGPAFRAAETFGHSRASSQAAAGQLQEGSRASAASGPPEAGFRAAHAATGGVASTSDSSHAPGNSSSAGSKPSVLQDGSSEERLGAAAAAGPGTQPRPDPAHLDADGSGGLSADLVPASSNDAIGAVRSAGKSDVSSSAASAALASHDTGGTSPSRTDCQPSLTPSSSSHTHASDPYSHPAHDGGEAAANPHADASSALPAADHLLQGGSSMDKPSASVFEYVSQSAAQEPAAATFGSGPAAVGSAGSSKLQSKRPAVLFAACWTQHIADRAQFELPANVAMCNPPDAQITFDAALTEVDGLINCLYGSGAAASWDSKRGVQDDESDEEAVEALSHALEQTAAAD